MGTKITEESMTSDLTRHTATAWPVPGEPTGWSVTWLPGRNLTRDQAVTAMTIAEMVVERAHILADPSAKLWWHMNGWADELGLSGPQAVAQASLSPEEQEAIAAEMAVARAMVKEFGTEAPELCRRAAALGEARGDGLSNQVSDNFLRFAEYAEKILANADRVPPIVDGAR